MGIERDWFYEKDCFGKKNQSWIDESVDEYQSPIDDSVCEKDWFV